MSTNNTTGTTNMPLQQERTAMKNKDQEFSSLRKAWAIGIVLLVLAGTSTALRAGAPELRTWTSTAGSTAEARLAAFSDVDATLHFADGSQKEVRLEQLSEADRKYLQSFPDLKVAVNPGKLPWVNLDTTVRSRTKRNGGPLTYEKLAIAIELENRESRELPLELVWMVIGKDLASDERVVIDGGRWAGRVAGNESRLLKTPEAMAESRKKRAFAGSGFPKRYRTGFAIDCYVVQVRWKDQVIASETNSPSREMQESAGRERLFEELSLASIGIEDDMRVAMGGRGGSAGELSATALRRGSVLVSRRP